ncbi:MAG: hypothetical protein KGI72_05400 [Patescibacteria group bacterium]|nr:hypothetical protein [Patescibacteria group bacterium]MDE2233096.1 hypothetical protein [Patescibacteria group bacterium]
MEPQQTPGTNTLDPTALALSRAIRKTEGTAYDQTIQEPNGTKSFGAYGWNGDNFQNWAKQYGLNPNDTSPTNQDHLAYLRIKDMLDKGMPQSQVAAVWNGAKMQNGQITAIDPAYVERVKNAYQTEIGASQSRSVPSDTGNGLGTFTPQPSQTSFKTPSTPNQPQSGGVLSDIQKGNVGGAVGDLFNFAFPVVSDVGKDLAAGSVSGSGKTFLQQLGDLGLTAAWLIPGFGELSAPLRIGLRAGLGYLAGTAANLGAGESAGKALTPNLSNVLGAATGGLLPEGFKIAGAQREAIAGITPQVKNILQETGTSPKLAQEYIDAAVAHAKDVRLPTPLVKAAGELDKAQEIINSKVAKAGEEVGAAKTALGKVKLPDSVAASDGVGDFMNEAGDRYGIKFTKNGGVEALPGREPAISATDAGRLGKLYSRLTRLTEHSSARQLSDAIESIDNGINYAKAANKGFDPLEQFLLETRNGLNKALRYVSPEMAKANDEFSAIKAVQNEVNQMAGRENQRGTLLIKRVFSGDKQGEVQDLFQKIKNLTGIDLTRHAVLAAHAIAVAGDKTEKGLLDQAIQEAIKGGGAPSLTGIGLNVGKSILRKAVANPVKMTAQLAGKAPSLYSRILNRAALPAAIRGVVALPGRAGTQPQ